MGNGKHHKSHSFILSVFPFLEWFKEYKPSAFKKDLLAGLTVSVVMIPQAVAYAILAGLPPVYGLYTAAITHIIGSMWGSLRQLATGPIAILSLMVLTTLSPILEPGTPQYIDQAVFLSFLVGLIFLLIGAFRMGIIMSFISHSAVKGFTSAATLIISVTQIPSLVGINVSRHEFIFPMVIEIVKKIPSVHLPTLYVGILGLATIYIIKKIKRTYPAGLVALVITTLCVIFLDLDKKGVAVIGSIPNGLPSFHLPAFNLDSLSYLTGPAIVISLVGFASTYSIDKTISSETKQKINVNQEFIGQGLANFIGSLFSCFPVSGSITGSAIKYYSGAKTGVASILTSIIIILTLVFLTPLFSRIPKAAISAFVISTVLLLFHPKEVFAIWKMNRDDGIVAVTVFVISLLTKPDYALLIGILMSLIFFLWKTMHPRIVRISKDPHHEMFVNADFYNKPSCPQILHLRSDNVIYFANAEYTVDHMLERLDEFDTPIKFLLLDFSAVGFVDLTGIKELQRLVQELTIRGIKLSIMGAHIPVHESFMSSGFMNDMDHHHLIQYKGDAIAILFREIDHGYCRDKCPYIIFFECETVK